MKASDRAGVQIESLTFKSLRARPVLLELEELLPVDRTRVAEDLRQQWAVGVRPSGFDCDLDPGAWRKLARVIGRDR